MVRDNPSEIQSSEIQCVFLNFLIESSTDNSILSTGQWSDRGCNKSESLSNTSVTVCECNHLTHFAILLSAQPTTTDLSDTIYYTSPTAADLTDTTDSTAHVITAADVLKEAEANALNQVSIIIIQYF